MTEIKLLKSSSPVSQDFVRDIYHQDLFLSLGEAFSNAVYSFLKSKAQNSDHTLLSYNRALALFCWWVSNRLHLLSTNSTSESFSITHFTHDLLADYQDDLRNNSNVFRLSPINVSDIKDSTVNSYMTPVFSFFSFLYKVGAIERNIAELVPQIKINDEEFDARKAFTKNQWDKVKLALDLMPYETYAQKSRAERMRFSIMFGYGLALRVSEQSATKHSHCYLVDDRWKCDIQKGKGGKRRRRSMHVVFDDSIALDALIRYRKYLGLTSLPVVDSNISCLPSITPVKTNTKTKKPLGVLKLKTGCTPRAWQKQFKSFLRNNVLPLIHPQFTESELDKVFEKDYSKLTPHSLRHSRISHLIADGYNHFQVSKFAGHSSIKTTQIYVDVDL